MLLLSGTKGLYFDYHQLHVFSYGKHLFLITRIFLVIPITGIMQKKKKKKKIKNKMTVQDTYSVHPIYSILQCIQLEQPSGRTRSDRQR